LGPTVRARRLTFRNCGLWTIQRLLLVAAFTAACWADEYPPPPGPYGAGDTLAAPSSQADDPSTQTSIAPAQFRDPIANPIDSSPEIEQSLTGTGDTAATQDLTPAPAPSKPAPNLRPAKTFVPAPPPTPAWPPPVVRQRHPAPPAFGYRPPPMPRPVHRPPAPVQGFRPAHPGYPAIHYRPAPAKSASSTTTSPPKAVAKQDESSFAQPNAPARNSGKQMPSAPETFTKQKTRPSKVGQANGGQFQGSGPSQFRPLDLKGAP